MQGLAGCGQNDDATGRPLPREDAQVDVTCRSWQPRFGAEAGEADVRKIDFVANTLAFTCCKREAPIHTPAIPARQTAIPDGSRADEEECRH